MTRPNLLELPLGVQLVYLAEGGANVIYRFASTPLKPVKGDPKSSLPPPIDTTEQCSVPTQLRGKLLRLRKETTADLSYTEMIQTFNTTIRPLFNPEELVDQTLIRLPEGLLQHCNERLRLAELDGTRPRKRHGGYLCLDEPFGLLITDMTAFNRPATLAEFKPKWLVQSPSAPPNARRCRTCALREMKNHDAVRLGLKEQRSFCPFDLVSERFEDVYRATTFIKGCKDRSQLARILHRHPTLLKLQSLQEARREVGLNGPSAQSHEMCLAMTLRDCTLFIRIPDDERQPPEIRLGDLDAKTSAGGKAQYWRSLELQLINGGWYQGSNVSQDPSECSLQHRRDPSAMQAPIRPI